MILKSMSAGVYTLKDKIFKNMSERAAQLESLVQPLLSYGGESLTSAGVRAIGRECGEILDAVEHQLLETGYDEEWTDRAFDSIRHQIEFLSDFESVLRFFWF